ncbi:STAS domain-containing protein [Actinomadura hibisca]|uniref:STAS domain-containing protein n=1 Tax=Actinomadura hibisca TaxID=68565 RepID=UPI00082D7191|nr:STAS domain-containing protein [Actinomadura hibisca]
MSTELDITVAERRPLLVVLAYSGELNLRTSGEMPATALALAGDDHPHVVLDLSGVPFCDSSGLNALIVLYRRLHTNGGTMTLAAVPDRLGRLLTMTGIDRLIPTHPTVEAALAAHPTPS